MMIKTPSCHHPAKDFFLQPAAIYSTGILIPKIEIQQSTNHHSPLEVEKDLAHLPQNNKKQRNIMRALTATGNRKHAVPESVPSPGTLTGTKPRGRKTPRCHVEPPPAWRPGSAPPPRGTTAPWRCACPGRAEVQTTAAWERTAAVPAEAYRCIAAADVQATAPHYHRDLERDTNMGSNNNKLGLQLMIIIDQFDDYFLD